MKKHYLLSLSILLILLSACQPVKNEPVVKQQSTKPSIVNTDAEMAKIKAKVEQLRLAMKRRAEEDARQQAEIERLKRELEAERQALAAEMAKQKAKPSLKTQKPSQRKFFRDRLKEGSLGPEMVWIPAGQFEMGDLQGDGTSSEKPVHRVFVKRFAIGRYEVTFAEYDRFAKATARNKPNDWGWGRKKRPVINITWDDAVAYTKWLSEQTGKPYRLPSEAEWEYAARAGTKTKYWWGNEIGSNRANCWNSDSQWSGSQTAPVGSFAPNHFGLYDTVGNVWEWLADSWHQNYKDVPTDGSVWEEAGAYRLKRGGSWDSYPYLCRCANRAGNSTNSRLDNLGFRVALSGV